MYKNCKNRNYIRKKEGKIMTALSSRRRRSVAGNRMKIVKWMNMKRKKTYRRKDKVRETKLMKRRKIKQEYLKKKMKRRKGRKR